MRTRSKYTIGAVLVVVLCVTAALAQPANRMAVAIALLKRKPLTVMPLRGGAYWVTGGVSNTGFIVGDRGVIAIDPEAFPEAAKKELAEIAKVTAKPVNAMILTHSDPDHVNGLPGWPRGMDIIAQDNAKLGIARVAADPNADDPSFPPLPEIRDYVPTRTVSDTATVVLDGVHLVLMHVAPAHTDGDLVTYLPAQKIVYAGDILTPAVGPYPGLHPKKQGSSVGWIATVKAILALDADTYVSGHGDVLTRAGVQTRLAAAEARRAEVKALVDQGKTLAEVKATLHDTSAMMGDSARFPTYIEAVYQELSRERSATGAR